MINMIIISKPISRNGQALQSQLKSLRCTCINMNLKIISLEATFKNVLVGGRTDMFRKRVPDGRYGN